MALTSEEREILAGLRAGDLAAADRLASLDESSQQRVVAALAQPQGPEPSGSEAGPTTSGAEVVEAAPRGAELAEVRARFPRRTRLLGTLVVLAALVICTVGGYVLYDRLFGDDASLVGDSSRGADRDRSPDGAGESAEFGGSSSDGQQQAPVGSKAAKSDSDPTPSESATREPMAEEEKTPHDDTDPGQAIRGVYVIALSRDGVATIVGPDGTELLQLPGGGFQHSPRWSPDAMRLLVATADSEGWPRGVFIYSVDLVDKTGNLDTSQEGQFLDYEWSADGSHVVFRNFSDASLPDGLLVMDVGGTDIRQLVDHGSNPVWSPDGSKVAYDLGFDSVGIFVVDADGRNTSQLVDHGSNPVWSPDGSKVAYDLGIDSVGIFVVDADGRNPIQLSDHGRYPVWAPDGSAILFTSSVQGDFTVFIVSASGSGLRPLTEGNDPQWSPSGSQIAFSRWLDGDFEVFVMDSDGTNIRQLTDNDQNDRSPTWSPVPVMTGSTETAKASS